MAPSFVNVINVFAFCNLHDVSWGTKGSDNVDALPSVTTTQEYQLSEDTAEEVALQQDDLDLRFKYVVERAISPIPSKRERIYPSIDDSNKIFRTRLVALWLLSNAILVAVIMNLYMFKPRENLGQEVEEGRHNQELYFKVILWSTFGLAFFRFCGCVVFWLHRQCTRWSRHT